MTPSRMGLPSSGLALVGDMSCTDVFGFGPAREKGLRGMPKVLGGCRREAARTDPQSSAVALVGHMSDYYAQYSQASCCCCGGIEQ